MSINDTSDIPEIAATNLAHATAAPAPAVDPDPLLDDGEAVEEIQHPPLSRPSVDVAPPAAEAEEPLPLPENETVQPKAKNAPRLPLTSADRFTTVPLQGEDVPITPATDGPSPNRNVHASNPHNTIEPFSIIPTPESLKELSQTKIFFLPEQSKELDERIIAVARQSTMETLQGSGWNLALQLGHVFAAQAGMVQTPAQYRTDSQWEQFVRTEANKFGYTTPRYGEENTPMVDGIRARIRVRALMGNGGVITIPLVRSGFWITLHAPTESAWYELQRRFSDDKIKYGREMTGMIFSNEQVYMNTWLLEFCLDHVYDATLMYGDPQALRPHIDALDLPILFAGMARLMYPRGFDYVRAVGTTEGIKSAQLLQGRLDIAKLLWVDNNYTTPRQKTHMANRARSTVKLEDVATYRKEFALAEGREIVFPEAKTSIILKTPSAEHYCNDGDEWIVAVTTMVDEAFTTTRPTVEERNAVISHHASMARMIRYKSFVSAVRFDGADHVHPEVIEAVLRTLSESTTNVELFEKEVKKFISDSTVSMIAIPDTTGVDNEANHARFPNLIPLDVVTVFFTLLAQKIQK